MWNRLQTLLLCLGLAVASLQNLRAAPPVHRPKVIALTLSLADGRSYALKPTDVADDHGGVVFWGDWAVYNIFYPYCLFNNERDLKPKDLVGLWNTPASSGELPAFLVRVDGHYCYPLNPAEPGARIQGTPFRVKVTGLRVDYADGRSYSLNNLELTDERSGVLFWQDFSVNHMLVPFYAMNTGLPTSPGDVVRLWNSVSPVAPHRSVAAGGSPKIDSFAATTASDEELPGFLVKPQCIPQYSMATY